jgi:hypothetical protein
MVYVMRSHGGIPVSRGATSSGAERIKDEMGLKRLLRRDVCLDLENIAGGSLIERIQTNP